MDLIFKSCPKIIKYMTKVITVTFAHYKPVKITIFVSPVLKHNTMNMKSVPIYASFLFMLLAVSCNPYLSEEVVWLSGEGQSKYWTTENADVSGDSLILSDAGSSLTSKFRVKNFDLTLNLKSTPGAEGSVAFHTSGVGASPANGYSVMINNSEYRQGNAQKTGSLSFIRNFFVRMVDDGEEFALNISVRANRITVMINDRLVSDYIQPSEPLRIEGMEAMVLSEGRIVIKKSTDTGSILIGSIKVTPLSDDIPADTNNFETIDETSRLLTILNQRGFPVIDFHGHPKGGLTVEQALIHGRQNGYNFGLASNCGLNFPITDDSSLYAYYDELKDEPAFKVMQCEGREWVKLFTPEPVALFDYIFSDGMTFTDYKGRRMRLWMKDEVFIDDEQQFMDQLVSKIVTVVSKEPVDIYVNPTFLPEELAGRYDELWTPERADRVIKALTDYDVALEINSRYNLPGMDFIKRAKAAGVKFTFGTNNAGDADIGRLEYSIRAVEEAGLTPDDIFLPRPSDDKKIMKMGLPDEITG